VGVDARKFPRSRVHLRVSYKRGDKVLEKFAENLSAGGLFLRNAEGLAQGEVVAIEIELPKHGVFRVNAEVRHALTSAGVGLQLRSPPAVFGSALAAYLKRLEQRTSAKVFVDVDPWRQFLSEASYEVLPLPAPSALVGIVGDPRAVGLLVPEAAAEQYMSALGFLGGDTSLVIAIHPKLPVEPLLALLDDKLLLGNNSVTRIEG